MNVKPPARPGQTQFAQSFQHLLSQSKETRRRFAKIEARLARLESQMTNQNRLLLIGVIALLGELAQSLLKP